MARYKDVPHHMKITSEMIEPMFGSILARLYTQSQYMKDMYGIGSWEYADALENLWIALDTMGTLSSLCIDTVHATLFLSKWHEHMHKFIYSELGLRAEDEINMPFRHNTNISVDAINADEARREALKNTPETKEEVAEKIKRIHASYEYMNSFNKP